jgi:hypothetical protein
MIICLAAFGACETNTVASGSKFVVSASKTAFYKFGPAQSFGPDFVLNEGAHVTMLEHSYGYSHVMTEDGTSGFVATEDLKPAPSGPYTTSRNTKTNYTVQMGRSIFDQPSKSGEKRSNVPSTPGSPLFDQGDAPLPRPDQPNKVTPGFHY